MRAPKRHPIALNLPRSVPALIVYGRHVVLSMEQSPWFPSTEPPLVDVTAHLDDLAGAEAETRSRAQGTVPVRDRARKVVEDDLLALKDLVRHTASQNEEDALAVIASAGMTPKRFTRRLLPEIEAVRGPAPGLAIVRGRSAGRGAAYEWQMSSDGGATWVSLAITTVATTSASGLAVGTTYLFRFRATVRQTTGAWSQVFSFFMH